MGEYFFELGRDRELSLEELYAFFDSRNINFKILDESGRIVIFKLDDNLNFEDMIRKLGGTIKIGKVDEISYEGTKNKIRYGVSVYDDSDAEDFIDELKNTFKREKLKAILVSEKGFDYLMPGKSVNLDLEVMIFKNKTAKVIAVFDPKDYKFRDARPVLDPLRVSSIRLSKILINLSGAKEGDLLLDPFCGVGTILQEGLLMGLNVIGIEKDKKSVDDCKKNLKWLESKYKFKGKWDVKEGDSRKFKLNNVDIMASEPYMGPFLKKGISEREAKLRIKELEILYLELFKNLAKIVSKGCCIVMPIFKTTSKSLIRVNFREIVQKTGFTVKRGPIIYEGYRSRLLRELWVVEPNLR